MSNTITLSDAVRNTLAERISGYVSYIHYPEEHLEETAYGESDCETAETIVSKYTEALTTVTETMRLLGAISPLQAYKLNRLAECEPLDLDQAIDAVLAILKNHWNF